MAIQPTDYHIDTFLTNILLGYRPQGFVADRIFPVVNVARRSNVYAKIDKGAWFRVPNTQRSPGALAREVSYTVSSGTYAVQNYELATTLPYEVMDNADAPHNPLEQSGMFLRDQLALDFEVRVANTVDTGVGTATLRTAGSTSAWDDFANSDPIGDCEAMQEAIRKTTGYKANYCLIGYRSWLKLRRHPDLVRAAYPGAGVGGMVTPEQFGSIIMCPNVVVTEPIKNTGDENMADSFTDVWSTHVYLMYTTERPGIMQPTFGYSFRWTGSNIGQNGPTNFGVFTMRDDRRKVQHLQTGYYQTEVIVAPELGAKIGTGIQ